MQKNINDFFTEDSLSLEEKQALWQRIEATNRLNDRKRLTRRNWWWMSAAASIVIAVGVTFMARNILSGTQKDIMAAAERLRTALPVANDQTLLVVNEETVVNLPEKEVTVTYNPAVIQADEQQIVRPKDVSFSQIITPRGKRATLTLDDGTKIWVNAGTRVVYPSVFEGNSREIFVDGEIYIEVAPDARRPFFVKTADMKVRVLGTKFNVTAYASEDFRTVALVEGSVEVQNASGHRRATLVPSQKYTLAGAREAVETIDVMAYISWIHGLYCFNSADLGMVLHRLSNYYGVDVEASPDLRHYKCSGKIDLKDNFDTVMQGLTFVAPIVFERDEVTQAYKVTRKQP